MTFDQAQSPRLGQKAPVESTTVRMFSGGQLPEASWTGQLIYRTDLKDLQVFTGTAWADATGGTGSGTLTYVGPEPPENPAPPALPILKINDLWYESDNGNLLHRWDGTEWVPMPLGPGSISVEVAGGWKIRADQIMEGTTLASNIALTGAMTAYGPAGERVGLSGEGFSSRGAPTAENPEGPTLVDFPVDGRPNVLSQALEADKLTVNDGAVLKGDSVLEAGSSLTFASQMQNPFSAPTVGFAYANEVLDLDTLNVNEPDLNGLSVNALGQWVTIVSWTVGVQLYFGLASWENGACIDLHTFSIANASNKPNKVVACVDSTGIPIYVFYNLRVGNNTSRFLTAYTQDWSKNFTIDVTGWGGQVSLGLDQVTGRAMTQEVIAAPGTTDYKWRDLNYNFSGTPTGSYSTPDLQTVAKNQSLVEKGFIRMPAGIGQGPAGIYTARGDSQRGGVTPNNSEPKNMFSYLNQVNAYSEDNLVGWPAASNTGSLEGATYYNGVWYSLQSSGRICRYENGLAYWNGAPRTGTVTYDWYRTTNLHHTKPSPVASYNIRKRARTSFTSGARPSTGADIPNRTRFYVGQTTRTLYATVAGTSWAFDGANNSGGEAEETTNNFSEGPSAFAQSTALAGDGLPLLRIQGGGDIRAKDLTLSGKITAPNSIKGGTQAMTIATVNTVTTMSIVYPVPFPAGSSPIVQLTPRGLLSPQQVDYSHNLSTVTGFNILAYRNAGTFPSTVTFDWTAIQF